MALVKYDSTQLSDPVWAVDPLHTKFLTPGALINRFDFPTDVNTSLRTAKGGTVLMRRHGSRFFLKASNDLTTTQPTTLTAAAGVGATTLDVQVADFQVGDSIQVGDSTPETKTISAIDRDNGTITITTAIATARAAGEAVQLATAVNLADDLIGEVVLLAQEYTDLDRNQEIVNLRPNNGFTVRINFLPDYSAGQLISPSVEAKIRDLYNCIFGVA